MNKIDNKLSPMLFAQCVLAFNRGRTLLNVR